ncbi:thioesterase family protein [cf. Phormidesmis sp. LEGE 11477]|uniref:acyl-CoA thioesterase n=1 Tax=cf. Phormidesmis sp. LEGE 11477 TaxID=1828680 RepID=UPI0018800DF6|nr:thioesterase family protein [cf. Phormidesmis sp. LEGE 11477]MBE9059584.1 acyl-CoA thioesterase [cf. Phormidesmis sp. LEGE 11477]
MAKIESYKWFEYPIRVQPHHTDYGGVVWHGTYITWLESARVECLRAAGVPFDQVVSLGYDLPVVALEVRYRQPLTLGMQAIVKTRLAPVKGVRLNWLYEVVSIDADEDAHEDANEEMRLCLSAQATLVAVNLRDRKITRPLPAPVNQIIRQLSDYFNQSD